MKRCFAAAAAVAMIQKPLNDPCQRLNLLTARAQASPVLRRRRKDPSRILCRALIIDRAIMIDRAIDDHVNGHGERSARMQIRDQSPDVLLKRAYQPTSWPVL
jgi:hypothetical protein